MHKTMVDPRLPLRGLDLIGDDGEILETFWHHQAISVLEDCIYYLWKGRQDFFAGGNMFIYYNREGACHRDFRGPDFFVVKGVPRNKDRPYWAVWEEGGHFPNFILELLSPSTAQEDRTTKKDDYEQIFHTPEYFLYDPDTLLLEGYRLTPAGYEPLTPNTEGRLWSEELGVWIGKWYFNFLGQSAWYLRFFDEHGQLIPNEREGLVAEAQLAKQQLEAERQCADAERQKRETESQRADAERQKREAAEAELARLRALLAQPPSVSKEKPEN